MDCIFHNITCLNQLNVSNNNITVLEESSKNIPNLKNLADFNLSCIFIIFFISLHNIIDEQNIHFLVKSLLILKYVSILYQSYNSIGKIKDLLTSLHYLSSIKQLKIGNDYINKESIHDVFLHNTQFYHIRNLIINNID